MDKITAKKAANKQSHQNKCLQKTVIILNIECIIKKVLSKKRKKRKSYKSTPEIQKKKMEKKEKEYG